MDITTLSRQQAFVFEGMLPSFPPEIRDEWNAILARKGERGIQQIKNGFRNSLIKKDCSWELKQCNVMDYDVQEILNSIKRDTVESKQHGVSYSAMLRRFHFNEVEIAAATARGDLWAEIDPDDGEEYWYEKTKTKTQADEVTRNQRFRGKNYESNTDKLKELIGGSLQANKAWMWRALPDKPPKSSGSVVDLTKSPPPVASAKNAQMDRKGSESSFPVLFFSLKAF